MKISFIAPRRGFDQYGSGEFGAPRNGRNHNGVDYQAPSGSVVISFVDGICTKHGLVYSDPKKSAYKYTEISDSDGNRHRFFYCRPGVEVGSVVSIGDAVGAVQNLDDIYPGIKNHVHYEIKDKSGEYLNPEQFWSE